MDINSNYTIERISELLAVKLINEPKVSFLPSEYKGKTKDDIFSPSNAYLDLHEKKYMIKIIFTKINDKDKDNWKVFAHCKELGINYQEICEGSLTVSSIKVPYYIKTKVKGKDELEKRMYTLTLLPKYSK